MKKNLGFTLVEVLVATSVIITTTTLVVAILVSVFRTSSKTTSFEIVRQNGNTALSLVSRRIQFAQAFLGVNNDGSSTYVKDCPAIGASGNIRSYLKITVPTGVSGVSKDMRIACTDSGLSVDGETLFDSNKVSVVPGTCVMTCNKDSSEDATPIIGLSFDLIYGNSPVPSGAQEKRARIHFSTSVKMRNK